MKNHLGLFAFAGITAVVNILGGLGSPPSALSHRCTVLAVVCLVAIGILFLFREELPALRIWSTRLKAGFAVACFVMGFLSAASDFSMFQSLNLVASSGLSLFGCMLLFMVLSAKPSPATA